MPDSLAVDSFQDAASSTSIPYQHIDDRASVALLNRKLKSRANNKFPETIQEISIRCVAYIGDEIFLWVHLWLFYFSELRQVSSPNSLLWSRTSSFSVLYMLRMKYREDENLVGLLLAVLCRCNPFRNCPQ